MKCLFIFLWLALANGLLAATGTLTNIIVSLELSATSIVAGEQLQAAITLSNSSPKGTSIYWDMTLSSGSGRFVVVDETGYILPRTIPLYYVYNAGGVRPGRNVDIKAGGSAKPFAGDLVWHHSGLTNPGNYSVKGVARLPLPNSRPTATVEAETPWVAITVQPRPHDMPPAPHVYASYYAMIERMGPEERAIFEKEQERVAALIRQMEKHPVPRAATKEVTLPPKVQAAVVQPANAAVPLRVDEAGQAIGSRSRTMLYGSVVLLGIAALGLIVWRARRKEHAP